MNGMWDPAFEAELAYRRERILDDFRRAGGRRRSGAARHADASAQRPAAGVVRLVPRRRSHGRTGGTTATAA